jgi:hypothetical protein
MIVRDRFGSGEGRRDFMGLGSLSAELDWGAAPAIFDSSRQIQCFRAPCPQPEPATYPAPADAADTLVMDYVPAVLPGRWTGGRGGDVPSFLRDPTLAASYYEPRAIDGGAATDAAALAAQGTIHPVLKWGALAVVFYLFLRK